MHVRHYLLVGRPVLWHVWISNDLSRPCGGIVRNCEQLFGVRCSMIEIVRRQTAR